MIIYPYEINSQYGPVLYFGSILRNELKVLFPGFVSKNFCSFEKAFLVYLITIKQQKKNYQTVRYVTVSVTKGIIFDF